MGYRVLRYDMSATTERTELLRENESYSALHVLQVPTGAEPELAIGSSEYFPIFAGFVAEFCPPEVRGLSLRSDTAVTGELILLAWFDGGISGGPN